MFVVEKYENNMKIVFSYALLSGGPESLYNTFIMLPWGPLERTAIKGQIYKGIIRT